MECEWCDKVIDKGVAYINAPIYYRKDGWVDVYYHLSCLPDIQSSLTRKSKY